MPCRGIQGPYHCVLELSNLEKFTPILSVDPRSDSVLSDPEEAKIRRCRIDGSDTVAVASSVRSHGIAMHAAEDALYYTDSGEGTLNVILNISQGSSGGSANRVLVSGLKDPEVLCSIAAEACLFVEATGRVVQASMDGLNLEPNLARPAKFFEVLVRRPQTCGWRGFRPTFRLRVVPTTCLLERGQQEYSGTGKCVWCQAQRYRWN